MKRRQIALVAHADPRVRSQVESALQIYGVETVYARTCLDVSAALASRKAPDVIFTGSSFANGNWRQVLASAREAKPPVDVVLTIDEPGAGDSADEGGLELEAMDAGAFDFVVLPYGTNIAEVLSHRFAKPRALQPKLWQRGGSRARRPVPSVPAPRGDRFTLLEVFGRAWRRTSKRHA